MAKKPRINSLLDDVANKVTQPQGIRAYHGSPHDFDRFDLSKIGTGEGAQAYGHGLYFAENEGIAKGYRDGLAPGTVPAANGQRLTDYQPHEREVLNYIMRTGKSPQEAAEFFAKKAKEDQALFDALGGFDAPSGVDRRIAFAETLSEKPQFSNAPAGRMYEVNIRANPEDFLDWDKPLSMQPKVAERFGYNTSPRDFEAEARAIPGTPEYAVLEKALDTRVGSAAVPDVLGREFYRGDVLRGSAADERALSEYLKERGIPGIKYLDAGSRSAGDGSRNYVVFDDALIDIIRKYGIVPGGLLGAGVAMAPSDAQAATSRPDWIGENGAITANPPWLRPDPNERSTLGKLYDAVTTNPVGTFKAAGSALGDAVKGYLGEVRQDPGKGVADALELGATAMGGAAPQAFWMATSPDTANAGEDAILAQRRKMMQGLLAD